jgi:hypothetical protein
MELKQLSSLIYKEKRDFGVKCKKYSGALTVELLKLALEDYGINVSPRDVFIKGIDVEIDLIIPKKDIEPKYGLYYLPEDVLAALEIKAMGSFGEKTITTIKENFVHIQSIKKDIFCAYITLTERIGFKWAVTPDNLQFPAYTLFWHKGDDIENAEPSGDYAALLKKLKQICLMVKNPK